MIFMFLDWTRRLLSSSTCVVHRMRAGRCFVLFRYGQSLSHHKLELKLTHVEIGTTI
ncbi:hypothetical protein PRUPE_7G064100 [Prunus persica]|uniref:Uncharacterized protein n=1 Tax=Prunus persica TaxID=3760 RepID=A0A251NAP7_PRUPE|nr:hypothetical protein PRUPE_7G064100 [Prunus persica]